MPQPRKKAQTTNDDLSNIIANNLKEARQKRGLTQSELADQIGVTREAIAAYESGRVHLMDDIIIRIATSLKISTDELLSIKENEAISIPSSLRFTRRMKELEQLSEQKQKAILKTLDDLIKANQ